MLLQAVETTEKETHSHDQEQIRQHTSNERGLDDDDFVVGQGDDGHNQLDGISVWSAVIQGWYIGQTHPNVAFKRPPIVSPVRMATSSVA